MSPCHCPASRAHPPASPSPRWSGAAGSPPQPPAHLVDMLPAEIFLGVPKIKQVWETRSTEGCEQVLGPVELSKRAPDPTHPREVLLAQSITCTSDQL